MFLSPQQCRPGKSAVQPFSGCLPTVLTIPLNLAPLPCSLRFRLSPPPEVATPPLLESLKQRPLGKRSLHRPHEPAISVLPYRLALLCPVAETAWDSHRFELKSHFLQVTSPNHPSSSRRVTVLASSGDPKGQRSHASPSRRKFARPSRPTRHPPEYRCLASSRQHIAALPWLRSRRRPPV